MKIPPVIPVLPSPTSLPKPIGPIKEEPKKKGSISFTQILAEKMAR